MEQVIFFGNGPLAEHALAVLQAHCDINFHARTHQDLATVQTIKQSHPQAHGVLASFGVLIKSDLLALFEPEGILNIHPSLLPQYRGASPIETAILHGDQTFSVSIMKLVATMDAGPIYHQATLKNFSTPPTKAELYQQLATTGANWLVQNLSHLPTPTPQDDRQATFCNKLHTSLSPLTPDTKSAQQLFNEVRAFQGFPKSRYTFFGRDCVILAAHVSTQPTAQEAKLSLHCQDGQYLVIDQLQPAGKKPMDAKSFLNGYARSARP